MTISEIQVLLYKLGFHLVGNPATDVLDIPTSMAIREFQRYARMTTLAKENPGVADNYVDRLVCVANASPYSGIVHGIPDQATTDLLRLWDTNNWRCPVVIQAWRLQKGPKGSRCAARKHPSAVIPGRDNLWLHDEMQDSLPRVYAFDFSSHFDPISPGSKPDKVVVGTFTKSRFGSGPDAEPPNHVFLGSAVDPGSEVRPETLIGQPLGELSPEQLSTFKVVRAVSEVECLGFLDSINGYDQAMLSIGLYNWTLGFNNKIQTAELAAFLAYLQMYDQLAYQRTVAIWGVGPEKSWGTTGAGLFDSQRKYVTRLFHQGDSGQLVEIREPESRFYHTWHWFYRFQAAARYVTKFRFAMWDMARLRIRDVLSTPWSDFARSIPETPMPAGTTLGDVYRSPLAVAYLLRWHILFPSHIVSGGESGPKLVDAFSLSNSPKLKGTPDKWLPCDEARLIQGLQDKVQNVSSPALTDTIAQIRGWPSWTQVNPRCYNLDHGIGELDTVRGSFKFDSSKLPPPPGAEPESASSEIVLRHGAARAALSSEHRVLPVRRLLYGYEGDAPTFQVTSDGASLYATYKGIPQPGPNDLDLIERLVVFNPDDPAASDGNEPAAALWALSIMPKGLRRLEVRGPTTPTAVLSVSGTFRCWLGNSHDEQTQDFEFSVRHQAVSSPIPRRALEFAVLSFADLQATKTPPFALGALRDASFEKVGAFRMPVLGEAIGLEGQIPNLNFRRRLDFVQWSLPASVAECSPPKDLEVTNSSLLGLRVTLEIPLKAFTRSKLLPFPLEFSAVDMPQKGSLPFTTLCVRQPNGLSVDKPFGDHWIFECQFPQSSSAQGPEGSALTLWNALVTQAVVNSLSTVQAGRPASFLPSFLLDASADEKPVWLARYSVIDDVRARRVRNEQMVVKLPGERARGKVTIIPRILTPDVLLVNESEGTIAGRTLNATLPGLITSDSVGLPFECRLQLQHRFDDEQDPTLVASGAIPGFRFGVLERQPLVGETPVSEPQRVRMGALDLLLLPRRRASNGSDEIGNMPNESESLLLAVFRRTQDVVTDISLRDVSYSLKVLGFQPGGQDDIPGSEFSSDLGASPTSDEKYQIAFERSAPLLIASPLQVVADSPFALTVREVTTPTKSQTIILRLRSQDARNPLTGADKDVIVIDTEPFLIARVHTPDSEGGLAVTDEIGHWTNRADVGGGWEITAGATGFDLVLPPQGLGETMHRSMESRDLFPGRPADFRFTPPAVISLQPSVYRQRFAEVPWNLRRVLGYPGQREAGAGVDRIRFEMLYGMPGEVTYPFLRLAELVSRLGYYPGQQPPSLPWSFSLGQCRQYVAFRELWKQLYASVHKRLSILEAYDTHQPFATLIREGDGLSYRLREKADLRYPIARRVDPNDPIPHSPDGLAGSFAWAFESDNVYRAVWSIPKSNTAELARPYFSALGGWSHQKASFDNRRTTIYSEVTMARLETLNIERIGRIGVFWNRAKHVIVYQRSVAASRQFFLEQFPFRGNAILRKVDEYVELIEDERRFPETNAAELTRGPVLACRFSGKPPRIRVNSRWGEDVGTSGWKIPLWLRGAAPADVYPKPSVHLVCAGAQTDQTVSVAIDEPEKLYFYTNTEPNLTDDTNLWPPVLGLDYGIMPPESLTAPKPSRIGDPAQFPVSDQYVTPGSSSFTLALAPSSKPVDIVAGRAADAISAALRNVTMMRGVVAQELNGDYATLVGLSDSHANALLPALAAVPRDGSPFDQADVDALLNPVKAQLGILLARAYSLAEKISPTAELERLKERMLSQVGFREAELRHDVGNSLWRLNGEFDRAITDLRSQDFARVRDEVSQRLNDLIEGGEAFEGYRAVLQSLPGTIVDLINQLDASIDRVKKTALGLRRQIFSNDCEICKLVGWPGPTPPDQAKRLLGENYAQISGSLREIEFLVAEVPRQWLGNRLDNLRKDLGADLNEIENLAGELRFLVLTASGATQKDVHERLTTLQAKSQVLEDHIVQRLLAARDVLEPLDIAGLDRILDEFRNALGGAFGANSWAAFDVELSNTLSTFTASLPDRLSSLLQKFRESLVDRAQDLYRLFFPDADALKKALARVFDGRLIDTIAQWCKSVALGQLNGAHLASELERVYTATCRDLLEFANRVGLLIEVPVPSVPAIGLNTIRLFRGFGEPPRLPGLTFLPIPNLSGLNCGYYFFDFDPSRLKDLPSVSLTPIVAKANQLADQVLNSIEVQLPTIEILDRFKPFQLQSFDLSRLFPNFAGLKLDSLFGGLRPPSLANDRVKVTHGEEVQSQSGWVQIDVDLPLLQPATVFSLAGVTMRILSAKFVATSRLEAAPGQAPRVSSHGSITGDWDIQVGGLPVAILTSTTLEFEDGGKIRFNVSPDRVKLQQVLAFLADLMSKFNYSDQGFSVAVTPKGIRTILDLPLPDIQAGAFGLANLRLGFSLAINILPEFEIATQLSVARMEAPFTLTIFILGGAGYLEMGVAYRPRTGDYLTSVRIGIMASASLAIALGPIKGGIYAYFGLTVDYHGSNNEPTRLAMGVILLFVGEVSLLGIISVGLRLGLEAQYTSGGGLKGRGFVSLSIKICWFITLDVHADVEYVFGSASGRSVLEPTKLSGVTSPYQLAAEEYIGMFA